MDSPTPFGHGPVHRMLGLELLGREEGAARARLPLREEFLQETGVVQGGVLAALADATAVYLLVADLPPERSLTSIEFKLSFLRPALPGRGSLEARAEALQRGRRIALCRTIVSQGEEAVAEGLLTYLFTDSD